jgi:hypothetical protein
LALTQATWGPFIDVLSELNVNCIRIYQICTANDPEVKAGLVTCGSHAAFMNALAAKGIYVIVPVVSGGGFYANTLRSDLPAGTGTSSDECYGSWRGRDLFQTAAARVAEFSQYNNTLAFNVGNELILYGYYPAVNSSAPGVGE